jgi:hypothetical protein
MLEQPDINKESQPSRLSLEDINVLVTSGEKIEADFVFAYPRKINPKPQ